MKSVAVVCLLSVVAVVSAQFGENDALSASRCQEAGYSYPDEDNLCFVWYCPNANEAAIKRACPKGVRVPSWWDGGLLNMCYVVNIVKHGGEPKCLRCDVNDERPTENCASNPCDAECTCVDTEHTYRCDCPFTPGVYPNTQHDDFPDHCQPNMCENGATCQNQYDGYFCFCPPGYTGHRCEIPICDWHPCLNGGTCVVDDVGYHCECDRCWSGSCCNESLATADGACGIVCPPCMTGEKCDKELDTCGCRPNLCGSGTCRDTSEGPRCEACDECFTGPFCKQTVDSCKCNNPCPANSDCEDVVVGLGETKVECICHDCWEGAQCENKVRSCDCENDCEEGELCSMVNGEPQCGCSNNCVTGSDCTEIVNTCECNNPCENGECQDTANGPICVNCDNCFTGQFCNEKKVDCDCNSPCNEFQTCNMVGGEPQCSCGDDCLTGEQCDQRINSCKCANPCNDESKCKEGPDGPWCECDCIGREECVEKAGGVKVCECPLCYSQGDRERGCPIRNLHLCECENPCTKDQQVCIDGSGPSDRPTCKVGNPSSGNAFTVVFEENETEYALRDIPLELYFTPAVYNGGSRRVNIQSAGLRPDHHCYFNTNFTIPENDVYKFVVERCMMHNNTGLQNLAIKATELNNDTMIVYGINKDRWTADGFLAVPDAQAGYMYQTTSYAPSHLATQFAIVALRDDTEVTMILSDDNDLPAPYNRKGSKFTVKMNAFQTFQVQARCPDSKLSKMRQCRKDLTGTVIETSPKTPIHVFSGNIRAFIETGKAKSRDHLIEQLVSVDRWGTMFGLVTVPGRAVGEIVNIMARVNQTTRVRVFAEDGSVDTFTLPENGRINRYYNLASGMRYYIQGDNPLNLMQLVKSRDNYLFRNETIHDPAAITIPPIEQFTNNFFLSTPTFSGGEDRIPRPYQFTVALLVAPAGTESGIKLNLESLQPSDMLLPWGPLAGDQNLVGAAIRVPHGTNLINGNSNFQCIIYGSDDRESYGFPAAMNLAKLVQLN